MRGRVARSAFALTSAGLVVLGLAGCSQSAPEQDSGDSDLSIVEQVQIDESDLRIDVYRSSGKGGQGVNTTDSAVRITHLPTGIVVTCQNERSQLQNKARAMQVLAARLQSLAEEQAQADASADRASQIRTVDRSERIRTYNFPQNRVTDHRIGLTLYSLDKIITGDKLNDVVEALITEDRARKLAAMEAS